eukprot:6087079-Lingulodinium_polyedra.AAC.1
MSAPASSTGPLPSSTRNPTTGRSSAWRSASPQRRTMWSARSSGCGFAEFQDTSLHGRACGAATGRRAGAADGEGLLAAGLLR